MKKQWVKCVAFWMAMVLFCLTMAGCSGEDATSSAPEVEEPLYPISINGLEIRVGETKLQALLDEGIDVTWSEMTQDKQIEEHTVDPEMALEANSYYTGGSVWITESIFAHISFVTEESVKLGEAVIARMEFYFNLGEDEEVLSNITLNGVPVNELNRTKAGEMFPDFTGDEVMWFSTGLKNYEYFLSFDLASGQMTRMTVERKYDVDWSSN